MAVWQRNRPFFQFNPRRKAGPQMKVRVLIADSCCMVREGLRALLNRHEEIGVVAEAKTAEETIERARKHNPHVVLLEATIPGMNGAGVARAILARQPHVRIIGLNKHAEQESFDAMFRAGAVGFMLKDAEAEELVLAVKTVFRGDLYVGRSMGQFVAEKAILARLGKDGNPPDLKPLTPREREIYRLGQQGLFAKQIASQLGVTARTVEAYRRQIKAKLRLPSRGRSAKRAE